MELGREWTPENAPTSSPKKEDIHMEKYFDQRGGLLFNQVNVAYEVEGLGARYVDGIRIIDPPKGEGEMYSYGSENRETIWKLLRNHRVDVVEVHNWGFDVLGHCIGKAAIIEKEFDPEEVKKTVIVVDGRPEEPTVEQVYEELDVDWVVIDP